MISLYSSARPQTPTAIQPESFFVHPTIMESMPAFHLDLHLSDESFDYDSTPPGTGFSSTPPSYDSFTPQTPTSYSSTRRGNYDAPSNWGSMVGSPSVYTADTDFLIDYEGLLPLENDPLSFSNPAYFDPSQMHGMYWDDEQGRMAHRGTDVYITKAPFGQPALSSPCRFPTASTPAPTIVPAQILPVTPPYPGSSALSGALFSLADFNDFDPDTKMKMESCPSPNLPDFLASSSFQASPTRSPYQSCRSSKTVKRERGLKRELVEVGYSVTTKEQDPDAVVVFRHGNRLIDANVVNSPKEHKCDLLKITGEQCESSFTRIEHLSLSLLVQCF
jgi:hypothetical protein